MVSIYRFYRYTIETIFDEYRETPAEYTPRV